MTRLSSLSVANNFLKSTGAISKLCKYIPNVGLAVSSVASSLGVWHARLWRRRRCTQLLWWSIKYMSGQCVPGPAFASKY